MQDDSSVFSAELHAILHAVKIVSESELNSMLIYTDSKSSLQLLSRAFPKNPIATEIQKQIFDSNKSVHICWVPSHVGILGNEHADRLANNATKAQIQIENPLTEDEMK